MPRQARQKSKSGIYHVMMRGNERKAIFLEAAEKNKFINILMQSKMKGVIRLYAYCVMDNHVHMIISENDGFLGNFVKKIGVRYAGYYNKKHRRIGHVFQDRFRSEPIEDDLISYRLLDTYTIIR